MTPKTIHRRRDLHFDQQRRRWTRAPSNDDNVRRGLEGVEAIVDDGNKIRERVVDPIVGSEPSEE